MKRRILASGKWSWTEKEQIKANNVLSLCIRFIPPNKILTFLDSSVTNIVLRSVPIIILSFANSNCFEFNFSAPSTAALIAATFTRFAKSAQVKAFKNDIKKVLSCIKLIKVWKREDEVLQLRKEVET